MSKPVWPKGTVASIREGREENGKTRIEVVSGGVFERQPLAGIVALARYEEGLRAAVRAHTRDKVFVSVLDSNGTRSEQRVLGPGEGIIFGRHSQASLHHPSDDISLRHLAIAVAPSSNHRAPLVRVWDLLTGRPFRTEDGMETRAASATGPLFLTLGALYIAVLPLGSLPRSLPLSTKSLWEALPERRHHSLISRGSGARPMPSPPRLLAARGTSRVTRLGPATAVSESKSGPVVAMVSLRTAGTTTRSVVTQGSLNRGLLIGRYDDRCLAPRADCPSLSRVHLLIARMGEDVIALDTASTHGTRRPGKAPIQMTVLEADDRLELADDIELHWLYDDHASS